MPIVPSTLDLPANADARARKLRTRLRLRSPSLYLALDYLTIIHTAALNRLCPVSCPMCFDFRRYMTSRQHQFAFRTIGKESSPRASIVCTPFQHDDGGWGWWKNDQSDPFMTAYVIDGLMPG